MGFGDKFKDLTQQAKEKVAENREKIQEAVDAASVAANERTHGKYANKIMKVNERTGSALDKFGDGVATGDRAEAVAGDEADTAAAAPQEPKPVAVGEPPSFADDASSHDPRTPVNGTTSSPPSAGPASGDGPQFDD